MNDHNLDSSIDNHVKPVDEPDGYEAEDEDQAEKDFTAPSRWWFSSTGIPLVAGTFGPISSAFSICALVEPWRMTVPESGTEREGTAVKDPAWLLVVNGISLAIAILANVVLLLNMARRIRTAVAQPLTIVGWYLSSFLLIGIVAAAGARLRLPSPPEFAWTQAYYYGLIASILYFIIASLMLITLYGGLRGRHSREFKLTTSQRTLMLQTIVFLAYVLLGASVYSHVEGWNYLPTVYWAIVTLLTVGFGDFSPSTATGRGLLFPFAIGGVMFVGLVIGSIRSLVLERGKQKMETRLVEKSREKAMHGLRLQKRKIRLGWFSTHRLQTDHASHRDLRRQEFELMRALQDLGEQQRRWTALAISVGVWLLLWLGGAAVFQSVEQKQGWTYFESMYFAFVALFTIGYGDFRPQGNAGTVFFVFWSLLAVPSLTVVISNMGDTVVKLIRDAVLQLGEWTILPEGRGFRATLRENVSKLTRSSKPVQDEKGTGFPGGVPEEGRVRGEKSKQGQQQGLDRMVGQFEASEQGAAQVAAQRGDPTVSDVHSRMALLMKAMRDVIKHLDESPPHKYSFDEWAWYLKLVGEEVESTFVRVHETETPTSEKSGAARDGSQGRAWGWLTMDSPLMSEQEEPRWLLERVAIAMEKELSKLREEGQEHSRKSSGE